MNEFIPVLDHRIRDVKQFTEKIAQIPLKIIVEGTRGKSSTVIILEEMMRGLGKKTFAKVTGEEIPLIIYNGIIIPLYRKQHSVLLDYETIPTILNFDIDAVVLENQAITPYTMRYLHQILRPQHVIIPNIRLDHNETLGADLEEMVHNFINNYRTSQSKIQVYYAEPIEEIRKIVLPILETYAIEHPEKIQLHTVKIPQKIQHIPGIENYLVDKYFIERNFGITLDEVDYVRPKTSRYEGNPINEAEYIRRVESNLTVQKNSRSVRYLNLAKVNDPFSFLHVMNYIFGRTDDNIVLVAFFREDRVGRTKLFGDIFPELEKRMGPRIKHIWLAGFGTGRTCARLPPSFRAITNYKTGIEQIEPILSYAKENDLVIVTMVNRVNPFMDELVKRLEER